jgi:hypothetical protein
MHNLITEGHGQRNGGAVVEANAGKARALCRPAIENWKDGINTDSAMKPQVG